METPSALSRCCPSYHGTAQSRESGVGESESSSAGAA